MLAENMPDFERETGNSQMYDLQLNVAGFLNLDQKGCTGGRQRVLWGWNHDPDTAPILQASCMKVPSQN
jgi:hypothetical protein